MPPAAVWRVDTPYSAPVLRELSLAAVLSIEACPRRGWLANSTDAKGETYPMPAQELTGRLRGLVVHGVVERLLKSQAGQGFELRSAIRGLGGWRTLIGDVARDRTARLAANARLPAGAHREFEAQLMGSSLLEEIQTVVLRMIEHLEVAGVRVAAHPPRPGQLGAWAEVELSASFGGEEWRGRADFVQVDESGVTISDFKSGLFSDESVRRHAQQLQAYAVLWNASHGGESFRLRVLHPDHAVTLAPVDTVGLRFVREALARRAAVARTVAGLPVPEARLGDRCGTCPVRHRCSEYWAELGPMPTERFHDFEVEITNVEPSGLSATVLRSNLGAASSGTQLVVARDCGSPPGLDDVQQGEVLRLLGFELHGADTTRKTLVGHEPSLRTAWRGAEAFSLGAPGRSA